MFALFWLLRILALASIGSALGFLLGMFVGVGDSVVIGLTVAGFLVGGLIALFLMIQSKL